MENFKLIIADDHNIIIDGIENFLRPLDNIEIVSKVNNGHELLKKVEIFKPDLVLCDVEMPVLNGIEASKQIKKNFPLVKIIILSMYKEASIIKNLIDLGIDGYLLKTSDQEDVVEAVKKVIKGQKYFSGEVTLALSQSNNNHNDNNNNFHKIANLSDREIEIMKLVCEGFNNKEIGEQLFISHRTVDTHRTNLMRKLEVNNVIQLIRFAIKNGMVEG